MSTKALAKIMFSAAAIAVVGDNSDVKCCKRSDLPVYNKDVCEKPSKGAEGDAKSGTAHAIESNIHNVRVAVASLFDEVQKFGEAGKGYVQDGVENAQWVKTYLGDEHNPAPKIPAIAIGGLAGFIFGLRGGFFRKLIFTSAGALGMASVCYPREARHYSHIAKQNGEKYATIAYNFMYGDGTNLTGISKLLFGRKKPKPIVCPDDSCPPVVETCPLPEACPKCECNCGAFIPNAEEEPYE